MENFVFPDENKTKLKKMYELMNIFIFLFWLEFCKKATKVFFIYTVKTVKKAFTFWTGVQRQMD